MRTLGIALVTFPPAVVVAHARQQAHVLVDSVLGVAVGVVAVASYLAVLRWHARGDGESRNEDGESRNEDGSASSADEH